MNRFRTMPPKIILRFFLGALICFTLFACLPANAQENSQPFLPSDTPLYSDFDTTRQVVYVFLKKELWKYSLADKSWELETKLRDLPVPLSDLEFGLNPYSKELLFWSRGIGAVYSIDTLSNSLVRKDHSFFHKNQFGHIPFFRNGKLHAFGGYGLWTFKNFISVYNPDIGEWYVHAPAKHSDFPSPRDPLFGFYDIQKDAFYTYGGTYSKNNRPDDKYVEKITTDQLWKYSFKKEQWTFVKSFSFDGWKGYLSASKPKVGRVNSLSATAFSSKSNIWYMPFRNEQGTDMFFNLVPYNVETREVYKPIEIPLESSPGFFVFSYFYNPKTSSLVLVGVGHLTNTNNYPLRIEILPEDSLLSMMQNKQPSLSSLGFFISASGIFFICLLIWYKFKSSRKSALHNPPDKKTFLEKLNEQEKKLFHVLQNCDGFMESSELEHLAWPDIKNYDYRRKLRNETINSINDKYERAFDDSRSMIMRKKDPKDHRRYLYGLNPAIIN